MHTYPRSTLILYTRIGLISYLIRDESQMSGDGFKLMLNDGDIDPINIRSSRSVFNYFIDPGSKQLLPWSDLDLVSSFELNPDIPLQVMIILFYKKKNNYYYYYVATYRLRKIRLRIIIFLNLILLDTISVQVSHIL